MRKRTSSKSVSLMPPDMRRKPSTTPVMERVDAQGKVIGFSIMGVSKFSKDKPLEAVLAPA